QNRQPTPKETLRGKPTALFFGFPPFPEVCPTTLFELHGWMEKVDPKGAKLSAYFFPVAPSLSPPSLLPSSRSSSLL
ncbi:SCO family protein, partial [Rhizobium johnstonii]